MPKIRFAELPRELWQHLLDRVQERKISIADIEKLQQWVRSEPFAPDGDRYKDFGSFRLCGSGEYPRTVLIEKISDAIGGIFRPYQIRRVAEAVKELPSRSLNTG